MTAKPIVSVCMITYNHQDFIETAINGVLMQECDFEVELIISNDNSTDTTNQIIQNCIKNHPNAHRIKYNNNQKNLGIIPNFIFTLKQCSGKYIALCDGDDYWTDSLKLQKQVDFLDENTNYSMCFHNVLVKDLISKSEYSFDEPSQDEIKGLSNLLERGNYMATCSIVFRNKINYDLCPYDIPFGDYWLNIQNAKLGNLFYLSDNMATYTIHQNGVYSSNLNDKKKILNRYFQHLRFWKIISKDKELSSKIIKAYINQYTQRVVDFYRYDGDVMNFLKYNFCLLLYSPLEYYKTFGRNFIKMLFSKKE